MQNLIDLANLRCPKCGTQVPITEAIQHQLDEFVTGEVLAASADLEAKIKRDYQRELKKKDAELTEAQELFNEEKRDLETKVKRQIEQKNQKQIAELNDKLQEAEQQKVESAENEKRLLREQRAWIAEKQKLELANERKLNEALEGIRVEVQGEWADKLELANRKLDETNKKLEEAKQKASRGGELLQGDIAESSLEDMLKDAFPNDEIARTGKGVQGGDVTQKIYDLGGRFCGSILYESKKTKLWGKDWIAKLKGDKRTTKASAAVLVSSVVPEHCKYFIEMDGVWVTTPLCVVELAYALRSGMIQLFAASVASDGRQDKADQLYDWMCGEEFRQLMLVVVEASGAMHKELNDERRVIQKVWAKRQAQIDRIAESVVAVYGRVQGIAGGSVLALPEIELLALESSTTSDSI